jgi:xanthine dehydrogenase YagS FAD-binding subunit
VHVQGPAGGRSIPITELYRLPGQEPKWDTTLEHAELITAVDLPPLGFSSSSRYRKVRERASYAFALVSVAAALQVQDGVVREARIALGGVAHKPWRAHQAEDAVRGRLAVEESFRAAALAELAAAEPLRDNGYKVPLAANVITRTLLDLSGTR